MTLSQQSIDRVIGELNEYKRSLEYKAQRFVEELAKRGIRVANLTMGQGSGDSDRNIDFRFILDSATGGRVEGRMVGEGDDILFWEFGAGIYYNNGNVHPHAARLGYGVNTYNPNSDKAINPGYWWYKGDDGEYHFSVGTEATMPMYKAWLEMKASLEEVAREVFGNG